MPPTGSSSIVLTFGPAVESIKELGGASTIPILDFMHIEKGNAREKITQWVVRNLCNMNKLEHTFITTLALGSRPRQGLARVRGKREAWESHIMLPGV